MEVVIHRRRDREGAAESEANQARAAGVSARTDTARWRRRRVSRGGADVRAGDGGRAALRLARPAHQVAGAATLGAEDERWRRLPHPRRPSDAALAPDRATG